MRALIVVTTMLAATAAHAADAPTTCETLALLKQQVKGAKFTPLTVGQFNFSLGAYAAVPPIGLPLADGAFLVQQHGKNILVWMTGNCASKTAPTPIPESLAVIIKGINPTAGETSDADDPKDELHL